MNLKPIQATGFSNRMKQRLLLAAMAPIPPQARVCPTRPTTQALSCPPTITPISEIFDEGVAMDELENVEDDKEAGVVSAEAVLQVQVMRPKVSLVPDDGSMNPKKRRRKITRPDVEDKEEAPKKRKAIAEKKTKRKQGVLNFVSSEKAVLDGAIMSAQNMKGLGKTDVNQALMNPRAPLTAENVIETDLNELLHALKPSS